jgi:hypothetical protein
MKRVGREDADGIGMLATKHLIVIAIEARFLTGLYRGRDSLGFLDGAVLQRDDKDLRDAGERRNVLPLGDGSGA